MAKTTFVSTHLTTDVSARLRTLQLTVAVSAGRRITLSELVDSLMDYASGHDAELARLIGDKPADQEVSAE